MLDETMKSVKEAERQADEIISEAKLYSATAVAQAHESAKEIKEKEVSDARLKAKQRLKQSADEDAASLRRYAEEIQKQSAAMVSLAREKQGKAVDAVISNLT